jgi:hypothetical protein
MVQPFATTLDRYMPAQLRHWIEQRYYAHVGDQASLERLISDPDFWRAPSEHPALFADHSVVHVRDVAGRVLHVLDSINGVLLPARAPEQLDGFMRGYAVVLAYLHDIGMVDISAFGRRMHPEFAAQAVFSPELDDFVATIWSTNAGGIAQRLLGLAASGALLQPPELVLRELLALSMGHSKSKVPSAALADHGALRSLLQASLGTELPKLYRRQQGDRRPPSAPPAVPAPAAAANLRRFYADFVGESYGWLVDPAPELRALADDVIDTLRALRCADALRQRGTVQKTSAGYEVYINQRTGYAECALRLHDDRLYLLELPDLMSAGEANLASVELDRTGDLRISFHRGRFASDEALAWAARAAAFAINDIQADVIGSFHGPRHGGRATKQAERIQLLLEQTDDNPGFVELVAAALVALNPGLASQIQQTISLTQGSELERARYLAAEELAWDLPRRRALLEQIAQSGQHVAGVDLEAGFRQARLATVGAAEVVIEANVPSAFVYVPFSDGLQIVPLGGYQPFVVRAWMPVGTTGVVRGAVRNATVIADRELSLLIIPKEIYLQHWHRPYTASELQAILAP